MLCVRLGVVACWRAAGSRGAAKGRIHRVRVFLGLKTNTGFSGEARECSEA